MDEVEGHATRRRGRRVLVAALVIAALLAALVIVSVLGRESSLPQEAPSATATAPPYTPAPYSVTDSTSLTVPEETRFARGTFWAEAGTTYLVTMDLSSTKPEGSGGRSMYLGVTLSCSPQAGGRGISAGGTQNMLTGQGTAYANQGLITVPEDGAIDCSIKASAPYDDVASNGATFTIDATWEATPVHGEAVEASVDQLPRTVDAGASEDVFVTELPLGGAADDVQVLASAHLTTCTGVNGSREDGRAWCTMDALDERGSTVEVSVHAELVDASGAVCAELSGAATKPDHIDLYRHHRLLSLDHVSALPSDRCGDLVRISLTVRNQGPAPVVVHQQNSTLVATDDPR